MSLLKFLEKIRINKYLEADIIIFLSTLDTLTHLKVLYRLNDLLEKKDVLNLIKAADNSNGILKLLDCNYYRINIERMIYCVRSIKKRCMFNG